MKDSKNGMDNLAFEKEKNDLDNDKKYPNLSNNQKVFHTKLI